MFEYIDLALTFVIAINLTYFTYEYIRYKRLYSKLKSLYTKMNDLKTIFGTMTGRPLRPHPPKRPTTKIGCAESCLAATPIYIWVKNIPSKTSKSYTGGQRETIRALPNQIRQRSGDDRGSIDFKLVRAGYRLNVTRRTVWY